jgi:hypothetical protein
MNKNLAFLLFAVGGSVLGFFLGRQSDDHPKVIDPGAPSSSSLGSSDARSGELGKENNRLRVQLDRAQRQITALPLATNPDDSKKKLTAREIMIGLQQAVDDPNPITRSSVFANLLANLNADNVESVLEVYENLPLGFENMHEYRLLLFAWGKFDAPAAIDYINSRDLGMRGRFVATGALEGWASHDPQAAIKWIKEQDDPRAASIYNFGVVRGWASHDVAGAADYVTTLDEGWEKGRMVGMLTSQFLKEGFPTARQWVENLEDDGVKASAFRNLSRQQSRENPTEVAAWLKEHAGKEYSSDSFDELGENWGRRDPTAAIEYFEALPDGEGRRQGMLEVVEAWTRKDSEAVGNWLNEKSESEQPLPELDEAIGEYAREVSRENAAEAMQWAASIQDEELKDRTVTRVGQNWMRQDEEAAKAWLPSSGLTEEVQKAIITPPESGRRWGRGPPH